MIWVAAATLIAAGYGVKEALQYALVFKDGGSNSKYALKTVNIETSRGATITHRLAHQR